jgi:curved DNA-binding protein CbpA
MKKKDYYEILEVERTASQKEIKEAYYKLIKIYHPDNHPGNKKITEKFYEINEAYRNLGDLDSRLYYSIKLNKDLLDKVLKHKKIEIPGYKPKASRKVKEPIIAKTRRIYGKKVLD